MNNFSFENQNKFFRVFTIFLPRVMIHDNVLFCVACESDKKKGVCKRRPIKHRVIIINDNNNNDLDELTSIFGHRDIR